MRLGILISAIALLATPLAAGGHEGPESDCHGTVVTLGDDVAYLVVEEILGEAYLFSVWLFVETNGKAGCQYDDGDIF